jgi:peroxiredoxin
MALTYSPPPEIGAPLPAFKLPAVDGKIVNSSDFAASPALLVMFICNHCPYVKAIEERLLSLAHELQSQGAQFLAVCSNDPIDHPDDRPEALLARTLEENYPFPYLIDSDQTLARSLGAVCTPDFFLYDRDRRLVYRGRLDDSWKDPAKVRKRELASAITKVLKGEKIIESQIPSMGCSIKWRNPEGAAL